MKTLNRNEAEAIRESEIYEDIVEHCSECGQPKRTDENIEQMNWENYDGFCECDKDERCET